MPLVYYPEQSKGQIQIKVTCWGHTVFFISRKDMRICIEAQNTLNNTIIVGVLTDKYWTDGKLKCSEVNASNFLQSINFVENFGILQSEVCPHVTSASWGRVQLRLLLLDMNDLLSLPTFPFKLHWWLIFNSDHQRFMFQEQQVISPNCGWRCAKGEIRPSLPQKIVYF